MVTCDIFFFDPSRYRLGIGQAAEPAVILRGRIPEQDRGANGVFLRPGAFTVDAAHLPSDAVVDLGGWPMDVLFHTAEQKRRRAESLTRLRQNLIDAGIGCRDLDAVAQAAPFVIGLNGGDKFSYAQLGAPSEFGSLFWRYADADVPRGADWTTRVAALARTAERLDRVAAWVNHGTYLKWRGDLELERKFTFRTIPDIWTLDLRLNDEIAAGRMGKFVPESAMSFQVSDYDCHLFDVREPAAEAGYISYIPQANGLTTVKRKWFSENAEIRRESLTGDQPIKLEAIATHVRSIAAGNPRRLPAFRRVRFDANFESLETGHVFGVYFDLCRSIDDPSGFSFGQCEVEYCRSRTLMEMSDVFGEFELVANYTRDFLTRQGVSFQHDLYSKLDFARSIGAVPSHQGAAT